ncbi:MAG: hypothetical protein NT031_17740, partial [Planctomycetota bacterium]|nr:hypothetical protein [Planctomycetota bacterium]
MTGRLEGTFALDGLVEGALGGAGEEFRGRLQAWADAARAGGLNLLFDLLKIFPLAQRRNIFSTLRSTEYRPGEEVQTIYAVAPDGSVQMHQRTVSARTEAPPEPLTLKQKLRLGAVGLAVAMGVFGLSSLFVDYGQLVRRLKDSVVAMDPDKVQV